MVTLVFEVPVSLPEEPLPVTATAIVAGCGPCQALRRRLSQEEVPAWFDH